MAQYKYKDGEYYYAPHRTRWGIWLFHVQDNGAGYGEFISSQATLKEARREVYKLNGWQK